jgi:hypothetical protein
MKRKLNLLALVLVTILSINIKSSAQESEPDFIGETHLIYAGDEYTQLDKEIGEFSSGMSFSSNSWNALSLEIQGGKSQTRIQKGKDIKLVVRAVDNNSDPLTIISIYKFKEKRKKRKVVLSEDNSGTLMKSRTHTKDMVRFNGEKYGKSSYLITLKNLKPGEYGIIVANPNNRDEKKTIVSCFAIDK